MTPTSGDEQEASPTPISVTSVENDSVSPIIKISSVSPIVEVASIEDEELESQAYRRFLFDFCDLKNVGTPIGELFTALPSLHLSAPQGSVLDHAIMSLAFANFGARCGSTQAVVTGRKRYGQALEVLSASIKDTDTEQGPRTLLAIGLLSIVELILSSSFDQMIDWATHIQGAMALMRSMSSNIPAPHQPLTASIKWWIIVFKFCRNLSERSVPQEFSVADLRSLNFEAYTEESMLLIYEIAVFGGEWNERLAVLLKENTADPDFMQSMTAKGHALYERYRKHLEQPSASMRRRRVRAPDDFQERWQRALFDSPGAPQAVQLLDDLFTARVRLIQLSASICLNSVLVQIYWAWSKAPQLDAQTKVDIDDLMYVCMQRILSCADELCETILGCFVEASPDLRSATMISSVDKIPSLVGHAIFWPGFITALQITRFMDCRIDVLQRCTWLQTVLTFSADELGIQQAIAWRTVLREGFPAWIDRGRRAMYLAYAPA